MLPFGTSLFAFYAPLGAAHLPRPVALGAAALLVAALAGWLVLTAASMTDEAGLWAVAGTVREVLLETSFGRVWVAQLGLAVLLLAGLLAGAPAAVVLALAGAALASLAWTGHPAAGRGAQGAVRVGAMAAHLLAGGAWLGGLVPLGLTLRA